jgi:diguanylate cyclase (GGDEF)-like protein
MLALRPEQETHQKHPKVRWMGGIGCFTIASMSTAKTSPTTSTALRLARTSWRLLYADSQQCVALAEQAFARAAQRGDIAAEGWARLTRGFHMIWYDTPQRAMQEIRAARHCLVQAGDRAGQLLAEVGLARGDWRGGAFHKALQRVLPLRDEGLTILKHDERGMLLTTIAGCYSELGQSQQAFAYMYQALRESSAAKSRGFDVVLHCNLSHELIQLGDYHQALSHLHEGLERCALLHNARLFSVLSINRVICLTNLGRAAEALPDVQRLLQLPADAAGRGLMNAHFETLALAALRAGDIGLGAELVQRAAKALNASSVPDERITLLVAQAELHMARGQLAESLATLAQALPEASAGRTEGSSLRVRGLYFQALAEVHERLGQAPQALAALRRWQALHTQRSLQASDARYQAAALQTELLRMRQELGAIDARRRSTEQARDELAAANRQLRGKIAEVEALQQALRQQATRDALTGLFNRRHLDDVLPSMLAMAQRDQQPLSVVIIDLDQFKTVNDVYGHGTGDQVLAEFGKLLDEHSRKSDVACRYGGDEFCLLMPRTQANAARRKCMALLKQWTLRREDSARQPSAAYGFSAGIADSMGMPGDVSTLLKAADDALLQAKRLGRNRVLAQPQGQRAAA